MEEITKETAKRITNVYHCGSCMMVSSEKAVKTRNGDMIVKASKSRGNIKKITISDNGGVTIALEWVMTKRGLFGKWKFDEDSNPIVFHPYSYPCSYVIGDDEVLMIGSCKTVKLFRHRIPRPRD